MKHVIVRWEPASNSFVAHGARADRTVVMNAPHEGGGPTGISPAENLLAALGGCTAWDVVEILYKKRQPFESVEVLIDGQQAESAPWPYTSIRVTYVVRGRGLDPTAVEKAVRLSSERYCSVIATVRGVADIETTVEVVDDSLVGRDAAAAPTA